MNVIRQSCRKLCQNPCEGAEGGIHMAESRLFGWSFSGLHWNSVWLKVVIRNS
jgi:hypothetical protein